MIDSLLPDYIAFTIGVSCVIYGDEVWWEGCMGEAEGGNLILYCYGLIGSSFL